MEARRQIAMLDAMEITALKSGDVFYLDISQQLINIKHVMFVMALLMR